MGDRFLLDAPSLVYRAFFALPKTVADPSGRPVNAVRGFMEMLARLASERRPAAVVAAFDDDWRPAFRVASYPGYKAARPEDPPELPRQFDVLAEVLDAAGVPRAISPGLEADDAIATLVEGLPAGERAVVVTGDRDLVALVRDPLVRLLFTVRGVSELIEFDEAAVERKFKVPPGLYAEFAMLRGDPSDGLPGVSGIGPVRAAKLLAEFGSVGGILENLDKLPTRQATAFDEARDYLSAMQTVVPLIRNAEIQSTDGRPPDTERLQELAQEHGLGSSAVRLARALAGAA
jgi:5'-3' exonuclease